MTAWMHEPRHETESQSEIVVKPTVCFWCKAECGLLAHVRDGVLLTLEEDPEWPIKCHPPTAGCLRRKAAAEYLYHPGRVHYPLKRVGERGEGKWQRIEWEDALDEIAQAHGKTITQVALNWVINFHGDTVVAIPGASKVDHARESAGVLDFHLTDAEMARLDELSRKYT